MVKIRLTKRGRKNAPSYRLIVANSTSPRDGKFIEQIGFYNPSVNPSQFKYNEDRYKYWVSRGAQPTSAVLELIKGKYVFKKYEPNKKEEQQSQEDKVEENNEVQESEEKAE
jgi:small subunit ribosomal protein S16